MYLLIYYMCYFQYFYIFTKFNMFHILLLIFLKLLSLIICLLPKHYLLFFQFNIFISCCYPLQEVTQNTKYLMIYFH